MQSQSLLAYGSAMFILEDKMAGHMFAGINITKSNALQPWNFVMLLIFITWGLQRHVLNQVHINGLVQERRNSSVLAMELVFLALTHDIFPAHKCHLMAIIGYSIFDRELRVVLKLTPVWP